MSISEREETLVGIEAEPALVASPDEAASGFTDLVSAPSDDELYAYFGPQRRWVPVCMTAAFLLAGFSLARFSLHSPWMWPMMAVLILNVAGSILSALTGWNRRRSDGPGHRVKIEDWATRHPVGPSVDVFLPTCGEDLEVLENTYRHVARLRWSGSLNVFVLDDAARPEVEAAAHAFNFRYLVRPNRGHMKKAGNLKFAFGQSHGEFIAIFDADFCPRADYLDHLIPYTEDSSIGIVQSPQYFSTTMNMGWLERTAGATQELFYRWVQPSRDKKGAPICVGTCAIYRRRALDAAGGFAQIEHSEDVHTGIFLLRVGFGTLYVPILVAKGLCPADLNAFLNQQYRWCNGSITLLKSGVPHTQPLKVRQRICFWAGFMYYITTAINVFTIHVPGIVMALFYASEIRSYHFIPFMGGVWVYLVLLPRVSTSRWRFEVIRTQMAYSFAHALAIVHKITGRTRGWVATGSVGKSSSLSRSISIIGSVTILVNMVIMWGAWFYDMNIYGMRDYWALGLFMAGYAYLSIPLLIGFLQVLGLPKWKPRTLAFGVSAADRGVSATHDVKRNRISMYEAVGFTIIIAFLTVLATGFFDIVVPWK